MIDKSLIIDKLKDHLGIKKDGDFAKYLGIQPNTLSNWRSRNTFNIDIISQRCEFVNYDWLLTGNGEMLKSSCNKVEKQNINCQEKCNEVQNLKIRIADMEKLLEEKERTIQILLGNTRESRITG